MEEKGAATKGSLSSLCFFWVKEKGSKMAFVRTAENVLLRPTSACLLKTRAKNVDIIQRNLQLHCIVCKYIEQRNIYR